MFDQIPNKNDSFLCSIMIKSHNDNRQFSEALLLYRDLRKNTPFVPEIHTYLSLSKACSSNSYKWEGQQLHNHVVRSGFSVDLFLSTSMVDMYAKMDDMVSAGKVFDEMSERSVVSWTALVCGYSRSGDIDNARKYFDEMPEKDTSAYNAIIDAYVKLGDMDSARSFFDAMPERNVISWTTLISGFCNINDIQSARRLFDIMPEKNLVSWNTILCGYSRNKQPHEALKLFHELQSETDLEADEVTIISILPAIADLGALDLGCWVHQYVKRKRLDKMTKVCTSLIDMYAKCGEITKAMQVFVEIPHKVTSSWNAMINGLAVNGYGKEALDVFNDMINKGYAPNAITMIGVLSSCSHSGLVEEGKRWLNAMENFGLTPQVEHYGCMIDLLGRVGCLDEAEKWLESMPYEANEIVISSFLSACVIWKDSFRAERVLRRAVKMDPLNAGNYVLLRNLYAMERRWEEVKKIKGFMRISGAKKEAGSSAIEANGMIWEFVSGGTLHPQWEDILPILGQLQIHMKGMEEEHKKLHAYC